MKIQNETKKQELSIWKKTKFIIVISLVSILLFTIFAEIGLMVFNPQAYEFPTASFSKKYRRIYYPNTIIEKRNPPEKRFFGTNELGFRGKFYPVSKTDKKAKILLLGDSYTFGIGVNDGYEFASILAKNLESDYDIVNLGMGGWGLTQEIRIFYDIGQFYNPKYIVLQFCHNDPIDNILDTVTKIENGKFVFVDSDLKSTQQLRRLSKLLSKSIIQKSNLYNLIRNALYQKFYNNAISHSKENNKSNQEIPKQEQLYCNLLSLFVEDLYKKNIPLIFISVNTLENGEIKSELSDFSFIEKCVKEQDSMGYIKFLPINDWFTAEDLQPSPIGHHDTTWNKILGENLADFIRVLDENRSSN